MRLLLHLSPPFCHNSDHRPPPHRHLRLQPSHHKTLRYLKSLGITHPQSPTPSPQTLTHILSTITLLKSLGFSEPDLHRLAFLSPNLFTPSFDPQSIDPVLNFLSLHLAASPEASRRLIVKNPKILESNPKFHLKPTLDYLNNLGITRLNNPTTLNAHLLTTRVQKLEEKMRFLKGLGFTIEESRRVCGRFPAIFGYGIESNLRAKYVYLVREMRRNGREEVNRFPQYFGFSLEKRIKVRHLYLKERNVEDEVPLNRMLLWSDDKFFKKWK